MSSYRDAKERGHRKYASEPCKVCGGVVRYTSSKSCVVCTTRRHLERKKLLHEAAVEQSLEYFDRYIAGDRK